MNESDTNNFITASVLDFSEKGKAALGGSMQGSFVDAIICITFIHFFVQRDAVGPMRKPV
jgi:hypothetical protein